MIKINENNYNNINIKVTYGNYSVKQNGEKREGESPIILFKGDKFYLRVETIYDKKWLSEMNSDVIVDITKYICDISYEDEKGWISLGCGKYNCTLKKIEKELYNIELICNSEEAGETFAIYINEIIKL